MLAQHLCKTSRWATPKNVIEAARNTMGGITIDPASEEAANRIVNADIYYTQSDDGLNPKNPWFRNVWCNPPGDKRCYLPKAFWERTLNEWDSGNIVQAMFLVFSLNQLQTLQDVKPPTWFPFLIFRKRLCFINPDTMESADDPAQGNALIYLPPKNEGLDRQIDGLYNARSIMKFRENFSKFGAITIPR